METVSTVNPKIASELLNKWKARPHGYMNEVLKIEQIWELQDELLSVLPRAMKEHKPIYIGSGHALGKDYICAAIACWFLDCFSPSIVVETAPTDRQVRKIMWAETLGHWKKRDKALGGTAYRHPYIEIQENWYLIGFTTKETGASREAEGAKFEGFHAPNILVIISEAQAVEDNIYDQIDAITTSENVLSIFIGNPTRATGRFAKGLRDKTNNIVFNFDCRDNPNYKQGKTVIPGLCSREWVERMREKWGEDDPRWDGRVRGQIPRKSINTLFSQDLIDKIKGREIKSHKHNAGVAIDVSGEGTDDEVIYGGKNGNVTKDIIKRSQAPGLTAIDALNMVEELEGNFIIVDCDGMGIKVWQEIMRREESRRYHIIKYHGSAKMKELDPRNKERTQYENLRAKAHMEARERAEQGLASIPNDQELIDDLMEPMFFEKNGKMIIEPKEEIKERRGQSPGKGDTWIMLQWGFAQDYQKVELEGDSQYSDRQGHGEPIVVGGEEEGPSGY